MNTLSANICNKRVHFGEEYASDDVIIPDIHPSSARSMFCCYFSYRLIIVKDTPLLL